MKKIYISIIWVIFIFLISCEINPFVGVGSTVDTIAPEVIRVTPANFSYVRDDFELIVTCYDNVLVTRAKLEIEKDNKKIFEKAENISAEKIAGYQTWKVPISLKDNLRIAEGEQGGEFKVIAYVYDERDNMSENSYKSVTIVVDVDTAEADIYSPELFKKAKCETLRNEEINPENFTIFQNSQFQISGECNDNSSIQSVRLTIRDENGETVKQIPIDEAFKSKKKYVSGSLYNWKLSLSATKSDDESVISLGEGDSPADTRFYEVFLQVKDSAGNVTFTEGNGYDETLGKSFGWFAVRQTADYPFSDFSSISDKVSVNSLLTGKSYDDDGIAEIKIYHKALEAEEWELIKSYSKDGSNADESLEGTPQIFTWKLLLPENATSSNYQLKVDVIDIYGKSSIEAYEEQYLSQDKILCSFGIVDPTAPSIEPIDLTDFKRVVYENGNFAIPVKASDNSMVKKIYVAWKPESTEKLPNWSEFAAKASNKTHKDEETGIKYWDISPENGAKEAEKKLELNIYDDFEGTYEKKVFYVYAEDDSGKSTEITTSMPKFTEMPEVTITSPAPGAVETTFNNQKFAIEVEICSYIKEMKAIEISCGTNSFDDVNKLTSHYDEGRKLWKHTCRISSAEWQWRDDEEAASYSLTAKVTDVFDNSNSDMLSFDIDNGVPRIKSVNAETEPGSYCAGSEIKIFVEMRKEVSVTVPNKEDLYLKLDNKGTAYYDKVETEGNTIDGKTKKIFFTYQVEKEHTSGAFNALELCLTSGVKIYDAVGNIEGISDDNVDCNIPIPEIINIAKNTSSMLIIDNEPPKIKSVTSITPNGSYTSGDEINLIVEFDEKVTVSGKPLLMLSGNQTAEYEKTESDTKLYFTYKVGNDVNIEALEWEEITAGANGVIKDCAIDSGNKVNFSDLQCNDNTSLAASGRKIKIDSKAPEYTKTVQNYTNEGLRFQITFDEPVYKVAGKKAMLHRRADAVPIVLSVDKYNEYVALVPGIASYYEKGVNGASSVFKIDNTTKYILKYEYDPTYGDLLRLFKDEKLGFYTQEIMMESNWVKNDGDSIVITIPPSSLLTGEYYWLTIEAGFVEDKVGLPYSGEYFSENTQIQAGTKAQPPVIRIQKITGGTAKTTTMKINTITKGAAIKTIVIANETSSMSYDKKITLGDDNYNPADYKITALAQIGSGTESDYGYEVAYKTVIYTSHGVKTSGDEVYFRGADVKSGSATVPNFPFSWDEASSPEKWDNDREKKAAEVGMIKANNSGTPNGWFYVVSWGVTDTLYFKPLSCKSDNGKFFWAWGLGDCAKVQPGSISDSNDNGAGTAYEKDYHDKSGG